MSGTPVAGSANDSLDMTGFIQLYADAPAPKPRVRVDAYASLEADKNVAHNARALPAPGSGIDRAPEAGPPGRYRRRPLRVGRGQAPGRPHHRRAADEGSDPR